jgi:signal transduction histidine kinase
MAAPSIVPLRFGTRTLGVVALEAYAPDAYPKRWRALSAGSSTPLHCHSPPLRSLTTSASWPPQERRRRLSREIHDGIAQELATLGYDVDDLPRRHATAPPDESSGTLAHSGPDHRAHARGPAFDLQPAQ